MRSSYRRLPSVNRLLGDPQVARLASEYSWETLVSLVRISLEDARSEISSGLTTPTPEKLAQRVADRAKKMGCPHPQPVINATGVVIHTNLGRAPLSKEALDAMHQSSVGYSSLEIDLEEGKRGSRQAYVENLLCQLTQAPKALVVNNNAASLLLGLAAIAKGGDVIISRGEAVEIGGGFRIPDILQESGATLVEVGTTNRTYIQDYRDAVSSRTKALLKVHPSNFRMTGFCHTPTTQDLVTLGRQCDLPLLYDLGSGCLLDTESFGLTHEPTPQEAFSNGAHLTFFSGDKLLGGPQAGIVIGATELVHKLTHHPLARAMRIDKGNLASLGATLLHYLRGEAVQKIPIWQMISTSLESLDARVRYWKGQLAFGEVKDSFSTIGGGSLPSETLPTRVLAITVNNPQALSKRLRKQRPPVICRIEEGSLLLDPRTVLPGEDEALVTSLKEAYRE